MFYLSFNPSNYFNELNLTSVQNNNDIVFMEDSISTKLNTICDTLNREKDLKKQNKWERRIDNNTFAWFKSHDEMI